MSKKPKMVNVIIYINVMIYCIILLAQQIGIKLFDILALHDLDSSLYNPITIFTYSVLHSSFFHIMFNMLSLIALGPIIEREIGGVKFLKYYLFSGVFAAFAQLMFYPMVNNYPLLDLPIVGASGAIFGLFALCTFLFPRMEIFSFGISIKWLFTFYMIYEFMSMGNYDGKAHLMHVGGAVGGFFCYLHFKYISKNTSNAKDISRI